MQRLIPVEHRTRIFAAIFVLAAVAACHLPAHAPVRLSRLEEEGEVWIYVRPLSGGDGRLTAEIASVSAVRSDGVETALEPRLPRISRAELSSQRLLAWGRLSPGTYDGLKIGIASAALAGEGGLSRLLVASEPTLVPARFTVARGKAQVIGLELRYEAAVEKGYRFTPMFSAFTPERPIPALLGYCSNSGGASLTAFDRQRRRVGDVIPTHSVPRGAALDGSFSRAYVASEDGVEVLDVATGTVLAFIALNPGDGPAEVAIARDGRTLLVTNEGSNTLAFLDVGSLSEISRLTVADGPRGLVLDPGGQRAFVLGRRSNAITVVDIPNRAVVTTIPTDPEPLRAASSRDGSRLYVVFAGSAYMTVFSLPDLSVVSRVFVGLGALTVLVDSRTDLVYVGGDLGDHLSVFDPSALVPVDTVDVPGEVQWLAIADAENALFALVGDRRQIAVVDLTSRERLDVIDVGEAPYQLVIAGQRR